MKRLLAFLVIVCALVAAGVALRTLPPGSLATVAVGDACEGTPSPLPFCVSLPREGNSTIVPAGRLQEAPACDAPDRPAFCVALPVAAPAPSSAPGGIASACDRLVATGVPTFCLRGPDGAAPGYAAADRAEARAQLRTRLGSEVTVAAGTRADLLLDAQLTARDRSRIEADANASTEAVETLLGRPLADRPVILAVSDPLRITKLLVADLGVAPTVAATLARGASGLLVGGVDVIVLNLQQGGGLGTARVLRHELTHLLVRQLAGERGLPAWVDEGLAAAVEWTGTGSPSLRERAQADARIASGTLDLTRLETSADWVSASVAHGNLTYVVAQRAVSLLEADLGRPALVSLLEASRERGSFAVAYESRAGRPLATFVADLPRRVGDASCLRAIRVEPRGTDSAWLASGLDTRAEVEISVRGRDYLVRYTARADADGIIEGTFGSTAPPGIYTLEVRDTRGELAVLLRNDGTRVANVSCG